MTVKIIKKTAVKKEREITEKTAVKKREKIMMWREKIVTDLDFAEKFLNICSVNKAE